MVGAKQKVLKKGRDPIILSIGNPQDKDCLAAPENRGAIQAEGNHWNTIWENPKEDNYGFKLDSTSSLPQIEKP